MKIRFTYTIPFFFAALFFLTACNEKKQFKKEESSSVSEINDPIGELGPKEYLQWYENPENNFLLEKNMNEYSFVTLYKPVDYLALTELQQLDQIDETEFGKIRKTYEGMKYFTFKISTNATNDELVRYKLKPGEDYYDRL